MRSCALARYSPQTGDDASKRGRYVVRSTSTGQRRSTTMPLLGMRRGGAPEAAPAAAPAAAGGDLDNRLQVRERLFAFGDDFWIENARGRRVYLVDGKALRLRDTL